MRSVWMGGLVVLGVVSLACGGLTPLGDAGGSASLGKFAGSMAEHQQREHGGPAPRTYTMGTPFDIEDGAFTVNFEKITVVEPDSAEIKGSYGRQRETFTDAKLAMIDYTITNNQPVKGRRNYDFRVYDTNGDNPLMPTTDHDVTFYREEHGRTDEQVLGPFKTGQHTGVRIVDGVEDLDGGAFVLYVDGYVRDPASGKKVKQRLETVVVEMTNVVEGPHVNPAKR